MFCIGFNIGRKADKRRYVRRFVVTEDAKKEMRKKLQAYRQGKKKSSGFTSEQKSDG